MSRKREFDLGTTLYPGPTAGNGKKVVDKFTGQVDGWNCRQCGFWCSADRVAAGGTQNEGDGFLSFSSVTGGFEPNVGLGGCPFCGTANSQ